MERLLKELLTKGDLKKLDIPDACLPLYIESLPKENEQVKEAFSHLPSLKKNYIERSLCHLYSDFKLNERVKIVIFTWVIGDGLGDYSAQIETAKLLSKELPERSQLTLISMHPVRMQLSQIDLECKQFFVPYEENPFGGWNNIPPVVFSDEILAVLRSATLILQIPTYFPGTRDLLNSVLHKGGPSYELIGEGGWGATPRFSPLTGSRSLGLRFFERGLFFPNPEAEETAKDVRDLEDVRLRQALLEGEGAGMVFIAYLREFSSVHLFLKTLLKQKEECSKDLSLCVFPSEELISALPSLTNLLKTYGIGEVKIFYEESFLTFPIKQQGKVLKIIQAKKMSRSDYQILLRASDSLVGCRGDGSLSETLAAGKIPFFNFPLHKKPLLEGLLSISNNYLSENHETSRYLKEFLRADPNVETLGLLAREDKTLKGFNDLSSFLKKNYSIDDFIKNLIKRAVCHHFYPQIAILEKAHMDPFFFGEKSAYEGLFDVKKELELNESKRL